MTDTNKRNTKKRVVSTESFETFLSNLDIPVKARLHVNGASYHTALVTVDFGEPLEPFRLTQDQTYELHSGLRALARDILGRDAPININTDNSRGVVWANHG
jgi:hypothetical protein